MTSDSGERKRTTDRDESTGDEANPLAKLASRDV